MLPNSACLWGGFDSQETHSFLLAVSGTGATRLVFAHHKWLWKSHSKVTKLNCAVHNGAIVSKPF